MERHIPDKGNGQGKDSEMENWLKQNDPKEE
jgi:hypothetical protein